MNFIHELSKKRSRVDDVSSQPEPFNVVEILKKNPLSDAQLKELMNMATLELLERNYHQVTRLTAGNLTLIFYIFDHEETSELDMITSIDHAKTSLNGTEVAIYQLNDNSRTNLAPDQVHRAMAAKFGRQLGTADYQN